MLNVFSFSFIIIEIVNVYPIMRKSNRVCLGIIISTILWALVIQFKVENVIMIQFYFYEI